MHLSKVSSSPTHRKERRKISLAASGNGGENGYHPSPKSLKQETRHRRVGGVVKVHHKGKKIQIKNERVPYAMAPSILRKNIVSFMSLHFH